MSCPFGQAGGRGARREAQAENCGAEPSRTELSRYCQLSRCNAPGEQRLAPRASRLAPRASPPLRPATTTLVSHHAPPREARRHSTADAAKVASPGEWRVRVDIPIVSSTTVSRRRCMGVLLVSRRQLSGDGTQILTGTWVTSSSRANRPWNDSFVGVAERKTLRSRAVPEPRSSKPFAGVLLCSKQLRLFCCCFGSLVWCLRTPSAV